MIETIAVCVYAIELLGIIIAACAQNVCFVLMFGFMLITTAIYTSAN